MTQAEPTRTRAWDIARTTLIVVGIALVGLAAAAAAQRPSWAVSEEPADFWLPAAGNPWFALAMCGAGIAAYAVHWWPHPRRARFWRSSDRGIPSAVFSAIVWMTLTAAVLGLASFAPCSDDGLPLLSSVTRTLLLFVGEFDDSVIGPAAPAPCSGAAPLALQVARFLAITVTFVSAVAVLFAVSRDHIARWRTRSATDVDVVVGLDSLSLSLVRALITERDERARAEAWYDLSPWERFGRRLTQRTQVIVIHPNRTDSVAAEAAEAGAVVLAGDPLDRHLLRPLLTHGGRFTGVPKSSLRRLFAVAEDQQTNLGVVAAARDILTRSGAADAGPDAERGAPRLGGLVASFFARFDPRKTPRLESRLIARLDDPREARDWGLAHLASDGIFQDAITVDDLIAEALCARLQAAGTRSLVLAGDTPLTVAILDVLAWTAWTVGELEKKAEEDSWAAEERPEPWPLREVVLTGPQAERVKLEWTTRGAPCNEADSAPEVKVVEGAWESIADAHLHGHADAAVVVTETGSSAIAQATRLSRLFPAATVYARDDTTSGLDEPMDAALVRFGPTLLQSGRVPEDSWTQLARFRHRHFPPDGSGRAARRRWDATPGAAGRPGLPALPDFLREDNLRQHREILRFVGASYTWTWSPVTADHADDPITPDADLVLALAKSEHERWVRVRIADRWSGIARDEAPSDPLLRERRRRNVNLWDWDTGALLGRARTDARAVPDLDTARRSDVTQIKEILDALHHWGIAPRPAPSFRRLGEATAEQLTARRDWVTTNGDPLHGEAGDWWVVSSDGTTRTVAADAFPTTYEHVEGSTYRRIGIVQALRWPTTETVHTREGSSTARPGDWIVTDAAGNSWPVPDAAFRETYAEVS